MYSLLVISSVLIPFSSSVIFNDARPSNHHDHVIHHNMTSEERMQVTYRIADDSRLNYAKKLATITNNTKHPDKEVHQTQEIMIHKVLLLKHWLDKRIENEPIIVQAVQQRKFKLLFTVPGQKHNRKLIRQTNKIIRTMNPEELAKERQVEREFHDKIRELDIHSLATQLNNKAKLETPKKSA